MTCSIAGGPSSVPDRASGGVAWHFASGDKTKGTRAQGSREMVSETWNWTL